MFYRRCECFEELCGCEISDKGGKTVREKSLAFLREQLVVSKEVQQEEAQQEEAQQEAQQEEAQQEDAQGSTSSAGPHLRVHPLPGTRWINVNRLEEHDEQQ